MTSSIKSLSSSRISVPVFLFENTLCIVFCKHFVLIYYFLLIDLGAGAGNVIQCLPWCCAFIKCYISLWNPVSVSCLYVRWGPCLWTVKWKSLSFVSTPSNSLLMIWRIYFSINVFDCSILLSITMICEWCHWNITNKCFRKKIYHSSFIL
jgi:hypothetical protein